MASKSGDDNATIVIKRIEVVEGGHHGGAWKVAYADFVTAMMAFFLVMWLVNATTEQQRRGLADYFSPSNVLGRSASGSGQPFGGKTPFDDGSVVSDRGTQAVIEGNSQPPPDPRDSDSDRNAPTPPSRPAEEADKALPGDRANRATAGGGGQATVAAISPNVRADYLAQAGAGTAPKPDPRLKKPGQPTTGLSLSEPQPGLPVVGDSFSDPAASGPTAGGQAGAGQAGAGQAGAGQASAGQAAVSAMAAGQANAARLAAGEAAATARADQALRAELARAEQAAMTQAAQDVRAAVARDPALADLGSQLKVEVTPEGLRIQILDADKQPMFPTGSIELEARARALLQKVAGVLSKLNQRISITGHTDAVPYKGGTRTNWDLSTERANATRRLLTEAGISDARFTNVSGSADRDPMLPNDPLAAANRRIAIVVLRGATTR